MTLANEHHIPTVLFCGNGDHRANQLATFSFEVTDERPYDTQNIQYTSFFGKLLLLMEYIVDAFTHVERKPATLVDCWFCLCLKIGFASS